MGDPVILRNSSDSYVVEKYPNRNHNGRYRLRVSANSANEKYTQLYFGIPSGIDGVTVLSANLRVWSHKNFDQGSTTLTVQRLSEKFSVNRVNFNNRPGVTGATVQLTQGPTSQQKEPMLWDFDVTALIQQVANGAPWYGFQLSTDATISQTLFAAETGIADYRPELEIVWSDAPDEPEELSPDDGSFVGTATPLLQWDFTDPSGDQTMQSFHLKIFSTEALAEANGTGDLLDEVVVSDIPERDLADTAFSLSEGQTVWWRVQVTDGAGLDSGWSEISSFTRESKGTLTLDTPGIVDFIENHIHNSRPDSGGSLWSSYGLDVVHSYVTEDGEPAHKSEQTNAPSSNLGITTNELLAIAGDTEVTMIAEVKIPSTNSVAVNAGFILRDETNATTFHSGSELLNINDDNWKLMSRTVTIPSANNLERLYVYSGAVDVPVGEHMFVRRVMVIIGGEVVAYFDGGTEDKDGYYYSWTGVEHSSTSKKQKSEVNDPTPDIQWTFTGQTQERYRVILTTPETPSRYLWDSDIVTSIETALTIPSGHIVEDDKVYRLILRVYDDIDRVTTPGDTAYVEIVRDFIFEFSDQLGPVTNLTGQPDGYRPYMVLEWDNSPQPDYFLIRRDGRIIDEVVADDLLVSTDHYKYTDKSAQPRKEHIWSVVAKEQGISSANNPSVTDIVKAVTTVLSERDGSNEIFIFNPDVDAELAEESEIHRILGDAPPVLITQSLRGYEGRVSGLLVDNIVPGLTAESQLQSLQYFRENPGIVLHLAWVDKAAEVVVRSITDRPVARHDGITEYAVSFEFFQVNF